MLQLTGCPNWWAMCTKNWLAHTLKELQEYIPMQVLHVILNTNGIHYAIFYHMLSFLKLLILDIAKTS